jgi:hypothetical protein
MVGSFLAYSALATASTMIRQAEIVDELMEALKYDKRALRPTPEDSAPSDPTH